MSYRTRNRDPYWLTARFESTCPCGKAIRKGDRAFYYPNGRKAVCADPCGAKGEQDLNAEKSMDAYGTDIY